MADTTAFTLERRERFLALLTVGMTVERAAADVISRTTISRWAARGRVPDATTERARFAKRYDDVRSTQAEDTAQREPEPVEDSPLHPYRSTIYAWALDGDPFVAASPDGACRIDDRSARARHGAGG